MNKPANYGEWWETESCSSEWYEAILQGRLDVHEAFMQHANGLPDVESVLDVGCGRSGFYSRAFAGKQYTGCDISQTAIDHRKAAYAGTFWCGDIVDLSPTQSFDLVFSHAVIDHVPDVDDFLHALVGRCRRNIYITAYRGWFPELTEHTYTWSELFKCFMNDLSPTLVRQTLLDAGVKDVEVTRRQRPNGEVETLIVAAV